MSAISAREEIKAGELIALEVDHPIFQSSKMALITRRGKPLLPATDQLLKLLRAELSIFISPPKMDRYASAIQLGVSNAE
ncbi:LysR family transcriptional regulator [Mycoavidus cysteinexigens]|uniref:LysR family transcriptional regulator n=1 Tax=Mycoavidus cysteinexigens TaxID=1553431 RepID=A0A2Z6EV30_9BURK|nr:hypothetical protein [Mycoavidus cysteinexigens]BBE09319.1 LysR family transcriptional regulator [Mycoavidus cysteinexigens]GAM51924.1 hypothetical protein EBME_0387 [bacterium endosymbiont of Mortierella elongata FMR23-6]GLR02022.1 hypothetical protein GCM10007934_18360 [Mycoavidus cysteinexigens]